MPQISKLQYDIEALKLKHDYEMKTLIMKQELELKQLIDTCKHVWDDGTKAETSIGPHWNSYSSCPICGRTL